MTHPSGPLPGIGARGIRDAHALAVLLLGAALGLGTALPLLGPGGPGVPASADSLRSVPPSPRPPERAARVDLQAIQPRTGASPTRSPSSRAGPLNLNTANAETLQALPGIGPALAERIVAYRLEHGPFQTVQDLLQVPGIGPKRWERMRHAIRVTAEEP